MHLLKIVLIFLFPCSLLYGFTEIPNPQEVKLRPTGVIASPEQLTENIFKYKKNLRFLGKWTGNMQLHEGDKIFRTSVYLNILVHNAKKLLIQFTDFQNSSLTGVYHSVYGTLDDEGFALFTMNKKQYRLKVSPSLKRAYVDIFKLGDEKQRGDAIGSISLIKHTPPFFFKGTYSVLDAESDPDEVKPIEVMAYMSGFEKMRIIPWLGSIKKSLDGCKEGSGGNIKPCDYFSSTSLYISKKSLLAQSQDQSLLYLSIKKVDLMFNLMSFKGIIHRCTWRRNNFDKCDPYRSQLVKFSRLDLQDEISWLEGQNKKKYGVPQMSSIKILQREDTPDYSSILAVVRGKNLPVLEKHPFFYEGNKRPLSTLVLQPTPRWVKFIGRVKHDFFLKGQKINISGVGFSKGISYKGYLSNKDLNEALHLGVNAKCFYMNFKNTTACNDSIRRGYNNQLGYQRGFIELGFEKGKDYRDAKKRGFENPKYYHHANSLGYDLSVDYKEGYLKHKIPNQKSYLWVKNLKQKRKYRSDNDVSTVAFSPDGKQILSGENGFGRNSYTHLWDRESGKKLKSFEGDKHGYDKALFSPNGKYIFIGTGNKKGGSLIDRESGEILKFIKGEKDWEFMYTSFSPDSRFIAHNSENKMIIRNTQTLKIVNHKILEDEVRIISYSPDGKFIVSGSYKGKIYVWDSSTFDLVKVFHVTGTTKDLSFSADGKFLLSAVYSKRVILWDFVSGKVIRKFEEFKSNVRCAVLSSDGELAATGHVNGDINIWYTKTGKPVRKIFSSYRRDDINDLEFSPDGKSLLSGSADDYIVLWSLE